MPRVKWAIDSSEPEELEGFAVYEGPPIERGVYNGVLTRLTIKTNSNGDDMLNGLWIARTNDPERKKFNGFDSWFNQNITEQGKPYVLQWLKSMGLTWDDFAKRTVTDTDERPCKVMKIGKIKFNDGNEPTCRVQLGMSKATPGYPARMEIKQFLKPKDEEDAWAEDDDADDSDGEDAEDNPFA